MRSKTIMLIGLLFLPVSSFAGDLQAVLYTEIYGKQVIAETQAPDPKKYRFLGIQSLDGNTTYGKVCFTKHLEGVYGKGHVDDYINALGDRAKLMAQALLDAGACQVFKHRGNDTYIDTLNPRKSKTLKECLQRRADFVTDIIGSIARQHQSFDVDPTKMVGIIKDVRAYHDKGGDDWNVQIRSWDGKKTYARISLTEKLQEHYTNSYIMNLKNRLAALAQKILDAGECRAIDDPNRGYYVVQGNSWPKRPNIPTVKFSTISFYDMLWPRGFVNLSDCNRHRADYVTRIIRNIVSNHQDHPSLAWILDEVTREPPSHP